MKKLDDLVLSPDFKSLPPDAWGMSAKAFLATRPKLSDFQTPVTTLSRSALDHNHRSMMQWCSEAGLALAPHGKTSMAPALWKEQLDAGAWGITLATMWQVQFARSVGVKRILLANQCIDPVALRWLSKELLSDDSFDFYCWADHQDQVELMSKVFDAKHMARPLNVIVELGAENGRTGARTPAGAHELAHLISQTPGLQLAGVGGYEGVFSRDRSPGGLERVGTYLRELSDLHRRLSTEELYPGPALITAGGSAFFDLVAEYCGPLADPDGINGVPTTVLLRSGAYLSHDSGHYARISPLEQPGTTLTLKPAIHAWTRVLSTPEPGLCIIDAGKRDVPYDFDMPKPQLVDSTRSAVPVDSPSGEIIKLNDQHGYLKGIDLPVGTVLRLGLSHPCTAFDKWNLIPVVDDAELAHPEVVDFVQTFF